MDQERNRSQDFTINMTLDVQELGSNRRKNCKPEKTIKADTQEQEYYETMEVYLHGETEFDSALQDSHEIKHEAKIMLLSKKHPQQAENCRSDAADSSEEPRNIVKSEPEEVVIQDGVMEFIEGKGEMDEEEEDKHEEPTTYVVSCCSNCLILKKEIQQLKAELERIKKDALPVPNQSVVDYFQSVIDTMNGKPQSHFTFKEEHNTMIETLCPAPPQQQVQLVKDCALFLETNVVLECLSSAREDPLQLLRNLIRATFTPTQLMDAGGLGLRRGHSRKPPLDTTFCQTLKTYIVNWCYKYGKTVPKERDLNRCFADTITYARRQATRKEKDRTGCISQLHLS